jgi:hypothetical protein
MPEAALPPGVAHVLKRVGEAPSLIVSFAILAHTPLAQDVIRDLLIEG